MVLDEVHLAAYLYERQAIMVDQGYDVRLKFPNEDQNIEFFKGDRKMILAPRAYFYTDNVFQSFDYFFNGIVPIKKDGYAVGDFSKPGWHKLVEGDDFFFTTFPEGRAESEEYIEYLRPKAGEIAIDLGAYCGRSATTLARAVGPEGRVFSYEPDPENFAALQLNIGGGRAPNVTATNKAVWAEPRSLWFSSEGNMGSRVIDDPEANRDRLVEVVGTTLEGILEEHGLERFDVIKMDIEGSEYGVLEASTDLIKRVGARWLIECHADSAFNPPDVERVRRILDACGLMSTRINGSTGLAVYAAPRI